jgi:hypothetical protein
LAFLTLGTLRYLKKRADAEPITTMPNGESAGFDEYEDAVKYAEEYMATIRENRTVGA